MIWLNTQKAAENLGISTSMTRRLLRTKKLNGYKINERSWVIYKDEKFVQYEKREGKPCKP